MPSQCELWQMSFSQTEKRLLYHADGTLNGLEYCTCRKAVIKLLKNDLEQLNTQKNLRFFKSYFVKTVVLNLFSDMPRDKQWEERHLVRRYCDALDYLVNCVACERVTHYVMTTLNVLEEVKNPANSTVKKDTQDEKKYVLEHFTKKRESLRRYYLPKCK